VSEVTKVGGRADPRTAQPLQFCTKPYRDVREGKVRLCKTRDFGFVFKLRLNIQQLLVLEILVHGRLPLFLWLSWSPSMVSIAVSCLYAEAFVLNPTEFFWTPKTEDAND
jgi:hypothetical protein